MPMDSHDNTENLGIRLIVIGGFLGAGKTTAILGIAKRLLDQGLSLGIVTNDQGSGLVDTEVLRQNGLTVMEISGGCFCCNFDQFSEKLEQMSRERAPDVILAEPVGSCTDLVATVMKPLGSPLRHGPRLMLAPLSVVVDPRRLRRVMRAEAAPSGGMPDEINYLFRKQLEEADIIALNKCDLLTVAEQAECVGWLVRRFPGASVIPVAATAGDGMADWTSLVSNGENSSTRPSLDIVYDTYAAAEAALGWLNVRAEVVLDTPGDGNELLAGLMEKIRSSVAATGGEIAHLKAYLVSGIDWCKMSMTGTNHPLNTDHRMAVLFDRAALVLNLRAQADPDSLREIVHSALTASFGAGADVRGVEAEAFRPSYPRPIHRMA